MDRSLGFLVERDHRSIHAWAGCGRFDRASRVGDQIDGSSRPCRGAPWNTPRLPEAGSKSRHHPGTPPKAWIEQALTSRVLLNISRPEFEENESRKYQPVIPAGPSPRNMRCSIAFRLDERSREIFQSVGLRRLVVEFKGKDNQMHQVPFCFNIEDEGIDRLFNSPDKQFRYISEDPLCPDDTP